MGENNKLFVGNLSYDATDEDVRKAFEKYQPADVIIITDRDTGRPRGFGFVTLYNESDAELAKKEMNGFNLMGRPLTVNEASAKRSGGGGGGGPRGGQRSYGHRDDNFGNNYGRNHHDSGGYREQRHYNDNGYYQDGGNYRGGNNWENY